MIRKRLCLAWPTAVAALLCVALSASAQELPNPGETARSQALFDSARMALHETQFEKADDLLTALLGIDSTMALAQGYAAVDDRLLFRDPSDHIDRALSLVADRSDGEQKMVQVLVKFAEGDLDACEVAILEFLKKYPDDRFANHLLGLVYNDGGRPEAGVEVLRELIRNHPDYDPAWNHLGYSFMEAGDLDRAESAFGMFLEFYPRNASAYDSMAELLARENNTDSAIEYLLKAVQLEPRMAYAWMHMGDIIASTGPDAVDQARAAYQKALDSSVLYGDEFRDIIHEKLAGLDAVE